MVSCFNRKTTNRFLLVLTLNSHFNPVFKYRVFQSECYGQVSELRCLSLAMIDKRGLSSRRLETCPL